MKKTTEHARNSENKAICLGAAAFLVLSAVILIAWPFFRPIRVVGKDLPYEYTIHGTYIELNRYIGDEEEVEIPERIWFRPVRVLGYQWDGYDLCLYGVFRKNKSIRKVSMPDSIQEIGAGCFEECRNLEEVRFSEELKSIGHAAFWGCTSLKYVEFPESLKEIKGDAFGGCKSLEFVEIPEGVEKIDGNCFWGTGWKESFQEDFVVVGKNVLIYYGGNEREVKVPEGVEYIGFHVFESEREMESLELPVSLKKCGSMIFYCKNLKYVTVRNPLMEFGKDQSEDIFSEYGSELTLIGEKGSTAEAYAEKWGHGFMELQSGE